MSTNLSMSNVIQTLGKWKLRFTFYLYYSAKRYTKKTRQAAMSSSLDPLGLPAAVARAFVCKKLVWSPPPIGRRGMVMLGWSHK
jgi:hypothetical protein